MRFACARCHTRYSIADEKVRQKILRIRCKKCGEVIEVQDSAIPKTEAGAPSHVHVPPPPPPPRREIAPPPPSHVVEWYVACNGISHGPFTCNDAARRVLAIKETEDVYVWKDGMLGWKAARDVPVIAHELSELSKVVEPLVAPPPIPPPIPTAPKAAVIKGPTPSPKAGLTPSPKASGSELPKAGLTPSPKASGLGLPKAGLTPSPKASGFELPKAGLTPSPKASGLGLPKAGLTPSPKASGLELPKAGLTPSPKASGLGLPKAGLTPSPKASGFELPKAGLTPSPKASGFELPKAGLTPSPKASGLGLPKASAETSNPPSDPITQEEELDLSLFDSAPTQGNAPNVDQPLPLIKNIASVPSSLTVSAMGEPGKATSPGPVFLPPPINLFPALSSSGGATHGAESGLSRLTGFAAIAHRHQGLKYLIAAGAIVVLVILLVILSLRGNGNKEANLNPTRESKSEIGSLKSDRDLELAIEGAVDNKPEPHTTVVRVQPRKNNGRSQATAPTVAPPSPPPTRVNAEQIAAQQRMARPSKNITPVKSNPFVGGGQSVTQEQITAVVKNKNNQVALKLCYDRALKLDDRLTNGRIDVTVSVGMSGRVQNVILSSPARFYIIGDCIKNVVRRWVFPASGEEYATSFPLILQGGM